MPVARCAGPPERCVWGRLSVATARGSQTPRGGPSSDRQLILGLDSQHYLPIRISRTARSRMVLQGMLYVMPVITGHVQKANRACARSSTGRSFA